MATIAPAGQLTTVRKVGLGGALILVVAVAYWFFFYSDVSSAISSKQKEHANLENDLEQAKESEALYQKDLADLTEGQQRERELNKLLPTTTEYPSFLSALQGVANVSGVGLQGWSPENEVVEQFYARVPMKLTLLGTFHQMAKFFFGVGQLDRIINIENIVLRDPKVESGQIQLKVDCLATAFHAVTPKATAPAPGAAAAASAPAGAKP